LRVAGGRHPGAASGVYFTDRRASHRLTSSARLYSTIMSSRRVLLAALCCACIAAAVPIRGRALQSKEAPDSLARAVLKELVEIPTTQEHGAAKAAEAITTRLIDAGFPREDVQALGPDPRAPLVVARYRGTDSSMRPVLFMAHMDVVPARREDWSVDPWTLIERDGWFYGRGTTDNKTGVTSLVTNFVRLKREGWRPRRDLIVMLTGDEETSQAGLQWVLTERRSLVDAELAINTDSGAVVARNGRPVLFTVQAAEKMYADYRLEVTDSGGHSSLPRANNPIYTLSAALERLAEHQFPLKLGDVVRAFLERSATVERGQLAADMRAVAQPTPNAAAVGRLSAIPFYNARLRTTCVATQVEAGHAPNALPQMARANVNCRILPGDSPADVEAALRRIAGEQVKVTVAFAPQPSPPSPVPAALLARFEQLVAAKWPGVPVAPTMETGATDGAHVRSAGIPTYGVSGLTQDPDDIRAHGKDERVSVRGFDDAVDFWYRLMKAFGEG
jgi:acetylornithine deacetylase/succinyl-diaminopimelate desuccinylase-like protein